MLSKETAMDIALAHRELETAEKLLEDVREAMDRREPADIRDAFGRRVDGLQRGVPSGNTGQRLCTVPWPVAEPVIKAHIANQKARIEALSIAAFEELSQ